METKNKNTPNRSPLIFYIILILLPILLLVGLEVSLRIFNYGRNLDAFITLSEEYDNYLFTNPDLPFRYAANMETPPAVSLDGFLKDKPDSTFRIFVMGGSSAAGFPYAYNATFPRYIKRKLEIVYPKVNFEVINLGITAHNSYTVADLADDVLEQSPDLVLVYAGHNEYYGILGVGSTIKFGNSQWLSKLIISLNKYKTYQFVSNLMREITSLFANNESKIDNSETLMSRMIGDNNIPYNSETYNNGVEQFRANMKEFLSSMKNGQIPVIIGGLTSNLLQPPFTSLVGSKKTKEDSLFIQGQIQLENNHLYRANESFFWAKEYDAIRFRAPGAMNKKLIKLSKDFGYSYLNIDSVFQLNSKNGIVGYNLMIDHLHPNITGYNFEG
ncbi:MAG: SGNH/GDSL hydrolase family protein, partial [Melioribacteraceae bacterium]|nr:SGNH/GDSL hydrolase family protein [Melioribacteraceae bacterium]